MDLDLLKISGQFNIMTLLTAEINIIMRR